MNRNLKHIMIAILMILLLTGCAGLVCRHNVMADAAWAEEQGLKYKIVVYQMSPVWSFGKYNAHAQVRTEKGWMENFLGYPAFNAIRTYPLSGWEGQYDIEEYLGLMRRNCFNDADCRGDGIPF